MLNIKQHFMLYRHSCMWRFTQKMIKQIREQKTIIVSKVVQNFSDMKPFKVSATVKFLGESGINSMQIKLGELTQKQKKNLLENQI